MEYYIDNRQSKYEITKDLEDLLEKVILESLSVEGLEGNFEVSISFVENAEIRELNRQYRNVDSETDVLSFPMEDEFDLGSPILGDIIISIEKAYEQSIEFGHSIEREIAYLTCHSMFHLMGYDHIMEEDKGVMRNKEKQVMKNLKIFKE
ncbi:rRNA maturation RNase YbeY [Tissierella creatinini]|nr:rRNA maturation RNase YbeY [Tissierella creatinini]TJX67166.1 rRNA maturation RNase YbeY [Soehngenia saccharolytica]